MKKPSAGILLFRKRGDTFEVLLGHPGGPFWAKKDEGTWSIPKGNFEENETPLAAAKREFAEETGHPPPDGDYIDLGSIKRTDGKVISVWAVEGDMDARLAASNMFEMEWPPKSGKLQQFLEIDSIEWIPLSATLSKIHAGQIVFIERLAKHLGVAFEADILLEQSKLL